MYHEYRNILKRIMESTKVVAILVSRYNQLPRNRSSFKYRQEFLNFALNDHPDYSADAKCPNTYSGK